MANVAFFSPFVPPEWIAAHGLRPQLLQPQAGAARMKSAALSGVCPYAGAVIEQIDSIAAGRPTSGDADSEIVNGVVLTTICDQMRYAATFIRENHSLPTFLLNVPSTWQAPAARRLYRDELVRLGRFLVEIGGSEPLTHGLMETMQFHDAARRVEREKFSGASSSDDGIPLALVGGPMPLGGDGGVNDGGGDDVFAFIARLGGRIVLDASEHGERTLPAPFDDGRMAQDSLAELVDAYFGAIPDVFRRPNTRLYEWLGEHLAERKVRGILFCRYVFCDLWHAELQRMREWSPVPVLDLDITHDDDSRPARTFGRIEAFLEMLQ